MINLNEKYPKYQCQITMNNGEILYGNSELEMDDANQKAIDVMMHHGENKVSALRYYYEGDLINEYKF